MPNKTCLFSTHQSEGAKLVDFAGWDMPLQYSSITAEHQIVREQTGIFDVSHMGRFFISGPGAADSLAKLVVSRVHDMEHGQTRYTIVCNHGGGARDDILVNRLGDESFLAVVNASNREKLLEWFNTHLENAQLDDRTFETGMIAIQGSGAEAIVKSIVGEEAVSLGYYRILDCGDGVFVSRTGYTGEDGFEVIAPNDKTVDLWKAARQAGAEPVGLGARDSLRLEMGFPLYGHELEETISPVEAGLKRVVHLDKDDFIGKAALEAHVNDGPPRRRIALVLSGPGVPRQGYALYDGDEAIGEVTSGGYSTVLKKGIALGLVKADHFKPEALSVEIRNKRVPAEKIKAPFVEKRVKV